jgi:outer membrane lipoprotein-sorting protein
MSMRAVRFLVALFSTIGLCAHGTYAQDVSASDLLKKVADTYRQASSYKIVAEKSVKLDTEWEITAGGPRDPSNFHRSDNIQVALSASSSSKAKLLLKDEKKEIVVVSDGKVVWTFIPAQQAYTEVATENTREHKPPASNDVSGVDLLRDYEMLLAARFESLSPYESMGKLEHSERLRVGGDKKECYVLMVRTPQGSHELWIDKVQFVIWKCVDMSIGHSGKISSQITVTVTTKELTLNSNLDDSTFVFAPPDGTKRVESLKLPDKYPF